MAINQGTIKIEGVFEIQSLLTFEMKVEPNKHGTASFTAILGESVNFHNVIQNVEGQNVKVLELDEKGNPKDRAIFAGVVKDCEVKTKGQYFWIAVNLISATYKLDNEIKSRSFQDGSMTYKKLIEKVLADTKQSGVIFAGGEDISIEKPLIQYEETDWEFIKRLASHFETSIIPETSVGKSQFLFGFKDGGERVKFTSDDYKICIHKKYFEQGGAAAGLKRKNYLYYEVKNENNYELGSLTNYQGREYLICQKTAEMVNGELKFTYILAKKAFIYNRKYYNEKIIGQCLQGTVLKVENETIKIHLDIDKEQEEKTAYFYDWVPSTGNLFYCMPKVGTKVSLYICNRDEQSAKAINCVRTNGENCSELQNYNNRYFTSEHNKRIYLLPDEMGIQGAAGSPSLQMLLQDDSGIMLQSNKEFTISASQAIGITGENVTLSAPKQVTLSKSSSGGSATVNICNQFDIEGQIGKLDGSGGDVKIPSISGSSGEKVRKVDSDNAVYSSLVSVPKKKSEKMAINKALGALPNKISSNVDLE